MTYINWNIDVAIDPATLSPAAGGIEIPTYGNYGGPGYSNGSIGGTISIGAHAPVDNLDTLFYAHDLAYQLQPQSKEIPSADLALLQGIELLTATGQLDAEASLYAGGTIFGLLAFMAVNGNLPSTTELVPAETTALYDIDYGLTHLTPAESGPALAFLENVAIAYLAPASTLTHNPFVSGVLAEVTATTLPAIAVEASMYGAVGTSDEIVSLGTKFIPGQVEHAINEGLDPLVYTTEALGLAFAFSNESGSTAFATSFGPENSSMPNSAAGDAVFAQAAANALFAAASTATLVNSIDGWVSNWKAFYSVHGVPSISNPSAEQIDLAARGAAWGDAVGVALANDLGPLTPQATNFLEDVARGTAIYSASLLSQPLDSHVQLTGLAASDHTVI